MDFKDVINDHKNKDAIVTLRVTKDFKKGLKAYAADKNLTVTDLILLSLQKYVTDNDKDNKKGKSLLKLIWNKLKR